MLWKLIEETDYEGSRDLAEFSSFEELIECLVELGIPELKAGERIQVGGTSYLFWYKQEKLTKLANIAWLKERIDDYRLPEE